MIEIRAASQQDISELARVHVKADWDTYYPLFGAGAYALEVGESELRWQRALANGGLLLVATDNGTIVGLGHACGDRIDVLYLLADYQRRGIGKAMLSRLRAALHERGIAEARFNVVAINAGAIAFYTGQGARPVGRIISRDARGDTEDLIFAIPTAQVGASRTCG